MALNAFDQTVPVMAHMLNNLSAILDKAAQHAQARKIEGTVLTQSRLFPDMLNFARQIHIATDTAKFAAARLTGQEAPSWPDTETTFEELKGRVKKAVDYLAGYKPEQFNGCEERTIELKFPNQTMKFSGRDYLLLFVLPNFYFHVTTAYNILRHDGVEIGKRDFLGEIPQR